MLFEATNIRVQQPPQWVISRKKEPNKGCWTVLKPSLKDNEVQQAIYYDTKAEKPAKRIQPTLN